MYGNNNNYNGYNNNTNNVNQNEIKMNDQMLFGNNNNNNNSPNHSNQRAPMFNNNNNNNNNSNNNTSNNQNQNQNGQNQVTITNQAFGIMISGEKLNTKCIQINNDKYLMEINKPGLVKSFGITILNSSNLPSGIGFAIYYSLPPFKQFDYIGILHGDYPSNIFESPWNDIKGITACNIVRIGFELKPKNFLKSLKDENEQNVLKKNNIMLAIKTEFAMKVANNLYNYMNSYVKTSPNGEMLVAPAKCLDNWHKRFKEKYIKDKNFMKTG